MALTKVDQTMVSDQVFGRRNVVINGAMRVAQRGTQTGLGSSGAYGATDRFTIVTNDIGGRMTIEQSTDAPNGFGNSVKLSCTTTDTSLAAGDYLSFSTRLEGRDMQRFKKGTSDAEKYAVSFYVKANANATYVCEIYDYDNFRGVSQTFSVTTAWTRVELSFPADTTGALDNDSNISFAINIYLHAGSNFNSGTLQTTWGNGYRATGTDNFFDSTDRTLFLTGVQLEVGDNATPFEHLSYGEEYMLCQRYYHKADISGSYPIWLHPLTTNDTNYRRQNYNFPTRMRATPSMTVTCSGTGTETTSGVESTTSSRVGLINDMGADSGQHYATCQALAADAEL
jgi:hypothetical protein